MTDCPHTVADRAVARRLAADPMLAPYEAVLRRRMATADALRRRLLERAPTLAQFAAGHQRFGLHRAKMGWVMREWAPHAAAIWLKGPFSDWRCKPEFAMRRGEHGVWELWVEEGALAHGTPYRLEVRWPGGQGDRLPAYACRVAQDPRLESWNAEVWDPPEPYRAQHDRPGRRDGPLLVYETHVGMAQQEPRVGTYDEFRRGVLPRVRDAGYNALQIMGLAEHPYYASFGYQVTSFFAPSSRFGTPDELKRLVDEAHGMGFAVLMDLVHSHCARNEVEGISRQDGSDCQYVHAGPRGEHPAWGSRCFDYDKPEVLEYLLSNCRYWMEEYGFDGFRFDGVTSMLYHHHGLSHVFTSYDEYFGRDVDEGALAYLTLANELIHDTAAGAITIAEDVSGMPGLAAPLANGGAGFDYRFAMGVADEWIRLTKDTPDEQWRIGHLWHELTNRRRDEQTISYAESHDQALVGDQTLIFRLVGARMYDKMTVLSQDLAIDRGIALHKLIRLATLSTAGHGYLNFMGNEFGHPEWIDFPREGNSWSYRHARRQWALAEDGLLRYHHLAEFDRALIALASSRGFPDGGDEFLLHLDEETKVLAYLRAGLVFVLNFHPARSFTDYGIPAAPGEYGVVLDTDHVAFGGHGRQDPTTTHHAVADRIHRHFLHLYLPSRTGIVLAPIAGSGTAD